MKLMLTSGKIEIKMFEITVIKALHITRLMMAVIAVFTSVACNQSSGSEQAKTKDTIATTVIDSSAAAGIKKTTVPSCCKGAPSRLKFCTGTNKTM